MLNDEFERIVDLLPYSEGLYELVDGEIVQKIHDPLHGFIAVLVGTALVNYWRRTGKGRPGLEVLHRVPGDPINMRQPDLSFFVDPDPIVKRGAVPRLPDLAVEIQSPSNSVTEMRRKAVFYLEHGVKMVWIVYTDARVIEVATDADVLLLSVGDTLTGGDLLPDFSVPVAEIFA